MLLQKEKLLCVIAAAIFLMASLLSAEAQQVFYLAQLNGVVAVEVMNSSSAASTLELNIHRADFPVDFFIGVGTSAAQGQPKKKGDPQVSGIIVPKHSQVHLTFIIFSSYISNFRILISQVSVAGAIRQSDKFPKAIDGYRRYMLI
ncbi:hypothetical protein DVH24_039766 [Malus domestica]|uniref:Uncharacterized protein n=1 Tax=Malus domestica TaxID=3750 RepID=A0A498I6U0_MALDO|nr:hypothetical protein DVH24_039766 [Malus domestica]